MKGSDPIRTSLQALDKPSARGGIADVLVELVGVHPLIAARENHVVDASIAAAALHVLHQHPANAASSPLAVDNQAGDPRVRIIALESLPDVRRDQSNDVARRFRDEHDVLRMRQQSLETELHIVHARLVTQLRDERGDPFSIAQRGVTYTKRFEDIVRRRHGCE